MPSSVAVQMRRRQLVPGSQSVVGPVGGGSVKMPLKFGLAVLACQLVPGSQSVVGPVGGGSVKMPLKFGLAVLACQLVPGSQSVVGPVGGGLCGQSAECACSCTRDVGRTLES